MTQQTEYPKEGEIVKWMANPEFCIGTITLKAATADEIYPGMAMRDNTGYIAVANGQEANVTAIALERKTAAGSEVIKALVRGPALVDSVMIDAVQDAYGDAAVGFSEMATYLAALDIRPYPVDLAPTTAVRTQTY